MDIHTQNTACPVNGSSQKKRKIVIIDNFTYKDRQIFRSDNMPKLSHGEVVERFIREGLADGYEIERCSCASKKSADIIDSQVITCLKKALKETEQGNPPAAINMSFGTKIKYDEVSKLLNTRVDADNLAQYKKEIKNLLSGEKIPAKYKDSHEIITAIENLTLKGIKVYAAAGNEEKQRRNDFFSDLTLADKINVVAAADSEGNIASFSLNNALVNDKELGIFDVNKIKDKDGKTGCDFTGDGTIDIYGDEPKLFFLPYCRISKLTGTSLAAPRALVRDLKMQGD